LDILYDAITGDAISGFAEAQRDMFNWWLIEGGSCCLLFKAAIYFIFWKMGISAPESVRLSDDKSNWKRVRVADYI
jgi:hypothetical protein